MPNYKSPIGKAGIDREDYGLTIEEVGAKTGMSKYAVWEMERRAIRKLWRIGVISNRSLRRSVEKGLTARIEALKCSISN